MPFLLVVFSSLYLQNHHLVHSSKSASLLPPPYRLKHRNRNRCLRVNAAFARSAKSPANTAFAATAAITVAAAVVVEAVEGQVGPSCLGWARLCGNGSDLKTFLPRNNLMGASLGIRRAHKTIYRDLFLPTAKRRPQRSLVLGMW